MVGEGYELGCDLIYHITHVRNLPSIVQQGGLYCDEERLRRKLRCVGIAHNHIKERRARRAVTKANGGTLADYVPFYFAPRSPMLYSIGGGFVEGYTDGEDPILHLVTSAEIVRAAELQFTFTDGHAELAVSDFFDNLAELATKVDWQVMRSRYWYDTPEQPDRKRKRQAEFLVHRFAPWTLIQDIGVKSPAMKTEIEDMLRTSTYRPTVTVKRNWYYR